MPTPPVVCALNLAEPSAAALIAAADLAERMHAPLHLVHARATPAPAVKAPPDRDAWHRAAIEGILDNALGEGATDALAPEIHVVHGDAPAHAAVRLARRLGAGLLVLGTHGRRGFQRFLLGSVAEEAVRTAPCPVWAVPDRSAHALPAPDRPVLVPVDFSPHSQAALDAAQALAEQYEAPLLALHVLAPVESPPLLYADAIGYSLPADDEVERAYERLNAFLNSAGADAAQPLVDYGLAAETIDQVAEERGAGCIVMGTHGLTGVKRALLGSVTELTLRSAPCPVLAVKLSAAEQAVRLSAAERATIA